MRRAHGSTIGAVLPGACAAALLALMLAGCAATGGPAATQAPGSPATPAASARSARTSPAPAAPPTLPAPDARPFDRPLPGTPLAPPLVVTGGFGEYRIGHFHAGFDFSTGHQVGRPVMSPANGWVERVRASGIGYGRSIYIHTDDGRLLQLGHLDAYAEPLAAWVRAAQDSSGQYEQDLWPAAGKFPVRTGQVIAWSGQSGAGGPHLHFEIRRGDMAYMPLRAGLAIRDTTPPVIESLTLEPLDDTSFVAGGAGPFTLVPVRDGAPINAHGCLRAIVNARDGVWSGVDRMVPWSVSIYTPASDRPFNAIEGDDGVYAPLVECSFDSVSWATDMSEGDFVYDAGRVVNGKGLLMWAPAGFRPRVMRTLWNIDAEAGRIHVPPRSPDCALTIDARDLGGNLTRASVILHSESHVSFNAASDTTRGAPRLAFASLPRGFLRVTAAGVRPAHDTLSVASMSREFIPARPRRMTPGAIGWSAIVPVPASVSGHADSWKLEVQGAGVTLVLDAHARRAAAGDSFGLATEDNTLRVRTPAGALFEDATLLVANDDSPRATRDLEALGPAWRVEPAGLPLRRAIHLSATWGDPARRAHVGLYRWSDDGWSLVGAAYDSLGGRVDGDSRYLGRFALFRDTLAPRVTIEAPVAPPAAATAPYSRWALEARVVEDGSGVDARGSYFEIDGRRVPVEWDPEAGCLRWRPAHPPRPGAHTVRAIVTDRAGNVRRVDGRFRT